MGDPARPPVPPWFQLLLLRSVQAGLCPLIPVPFVDDWALGRVRAWMVADTLARHGIPLDDRVRVLAREGERRSVLAGCLLWVALRPARWILRKTFLVLTMKGAVDVAGTVFQEGYLLEGAAARGWLSSAEAAQRARLAIRATCRAMDPGPVRQVIARAFAGGRDVLRVGAASLGKLLRRERQRHPRDASPAASTAPPAADQATLLARVIEPVVHGLWYRQDYLDALAARFDLEHASLPSPQAPSGPPGASPPDR